MPARGMRASYSNNASAHDTTHTHTLHTLHAHDTRCTGQSPRLEQLVLLPSTLVLLPLLRVSWPPAHSAVRGMKQRRAHVCRVRHAGGAEAASR
jgi:hypothetical protein